MVASVLARPRLWWVGGRQVARLAPSGWWRRFPFLPLPDRRYATFRSETMYGDGRPPAPADLLTWLDWCRDIEPFLPERRRGHQLP